jgi:hypothetical protein
VYFHALHKGLSSEKNGGKSNEIMGIMCDMLIEVGWLYLCLVASCGGT